MPAVFATWHGPAVAAVATRNGEPARLRAIRIERQRGEHDGVHLGSPRGPDGVVEEARGMARARRVVGGRDRQRDAPNTRSAFSCRHRMTPDSLRNACVCAAELGDELHVLGLRHEAGLQAVLRVDLLVLRVREQLRHRRVPRGDHLARCALRSGQAAELAHRRGRCPAPSPSARRETAAAARRRRPRAAAACRASSCAADLLQLADAHVERVVQHVDQHVAAALEGGDDRRDAGALLQPLERLPLERRRVGGAPPALARCARRRSRRAAS